MRFGVIGTNTVTDWFLQAGQLCDEFSLTTVYSRTREKAQAYARANQAPCYTDSLEDLANSTQVDAVYVASPNHLHHAQALRLLQGGKHVLCEKPATSHAREWRHLLEVARQNKVLVMEAMRPAYLPALPVLRALLSEIGPVRRASLSVCKYSSRYDRFRAGETPNAFNPAFSSGALMDLGVYCVHVLLRLFGPPLSTQSTCVKLRNGVDGAGTILASYADKIVDLHYSKISNTYQPCEIQGEEGSLFFRDCIALQQLQLIRRGETHCTQIPTDAADRDMLHEISAFIQFTKSPKKIERENWFSQKALTILDTTRAQCGIVFAADSSLGGLRDQFTV